MKQSWFHIVLIFFFMFKNKTININKIRRTEIYIGKWKQILCLETKQWNMWKLYKKAVLISIDEL